jgi:hypothetical protein
MNWRDYPPRTVNRGGTPDPREVVGREEVVSQMWRALEKQSVLLTAERRVGKTSVLLLMEDRPEPDTLVFRRDLEGVRTPVEFVERVLQDISANLSAKQRTAGWFQKTWKAIGGTEVGGIIKLPEAQTAHWKTGLERVILDLVTNQEKRVVFLWDELPLMLDNIVQRSDEQSAMEVLDTLRALRQQHPARLRMVYTGSIGLHHVLAALRRARYGNAPTNDMLPRDLGALGQDAAWGLAWSLLQGHQLVADDPEAVVQRIAELVDNLPFYIQHVVGKLSDSGGKVTPAAVDSAVVELLIDANDPWEMRNYRKRIDKYYIEAHRPFALGMLDALSIAPEPLEFTDLVNLLRHATITQDDETARDVLDLLQQDHYVMVESGTGFRFRFGIVGRAWRTLRRLR